MPALDWITVEGFKSIESIDRLPLRPINVLIGPNGSGKSNVIEIFPFLNAIRNGELRKYVARAGGAEKILHFGTRKTSHLVIHLSLENEAIQYKIVLRPNESNILFPSEEIVIFRDKNDTRSNHFDLTRYEGESGISRTNPDHKILQYLRDHIDCWHLYHFHDTSITSAMSGMPLSRYHQL